MKTYLYLRDYSFDFELPNSREAVEHVSKAAITILPLISLYKPVQPLVNTTLSIARAGFHSFSTYTAFSNSDYQKTCVEFWNTTYSVATVAVSFFSFEAGKRVLAVHDLAIAGRDVIWCKEGERSYAVLKLASQAIYTGMLFYGSLELSIAMYLIQALAQIANAYKAYEKGEKLSCAVALTLAGVHLNSSHCQWTLLQKRNGFLQKGGLFEQIFLAKKAKSAISPELQKAIETAKVTKVGRHIHGFGQEIVKNGNLILSERNGEYELRFRLTHPVREGVEALFEENFSLGSDDWKEFCEILQIDSDSLSITMNKPLSTVFKNAAKIHEFSLKGVGSIAVGSSKEQPLIYNEVVIKTANLANLPQLLSLLNLERAIDSMRAEDIDRMKIWHLFRIFYPKEAYFMERDSSLFLKTSPESLQCKIEERVPGMCMIFDKHLMKMQAIEILPGRYVYGIAGIKEFAKALGGKSLFSTISSDGTGSYIDVLLSILDNGMLSTDLRAKAGVGVEGWSSSEDYATGGADRVFTRLEAENQPLPSTAYDDIRIHFDLECLETGAYHYHHDAYGTRVDEDYQNRPYIIDFILGQLNSPTASNEVMIRDAIKPKWISHIVFADEGIRDDLLARLREENRLSIENGKETFNGKAIDEFFLVEDRPKVDDNDFFSIEDCTKIDGDD